jgi:polyphosphate kinase
MRRYVHIGTGNYNPKTARLYTDFGLLSDDPELGADLTDLFNVLTGFGQPAGYRKLIVAPRGMRERFIEMIRREIRHQEAGRPARIFAKMNALVHPDIIAALCEASRAVPIDLIVRGNLLPRRASGRERDPGDQHHRTLLEHSRSLHFLNGGQEEVYMARLTDASNGSPVEAVLPISRPTARRSAPCSS